MKVFSVVFSLIFMLLAAPAFTSDTCGLKPQTVQVDDLTAVVSCLSTGFPEGSLAKFGAPNVHVSILTEAQLKKVFSELASIHEIPFDYPEDGCYARAMEMSRIMEKEGIISGKAIVQVPHTSTFDAKENKWDMKAKCHKKGDEDVCPLLEAQTKNSPKGFVEWIWHIAPVVLTKGKNGALVPMIIDPSLFDHPVSASVWEKKMVTSEHPAATLEYHSRFRYGLTDPENDNRTDYSDWTITEMEKKLKEYRKTADEREGKAQPGGTQP